MKPVLVIMAAGMGSRYGGLKQIDPVDEEGDKIIDFSLYDAKRAGFEKAVFVIKKENEELFKECITDRISGKLQIEFAYQDLNDIPEGFTVPEERVKPWGTAHAVYAARAAVGEAPFAVINVDDYYGVEAFKKLYDFLSTHEDDEKYRYAMVGYRLGNTLTENGSVSRGCCSTDSEGYLTDIVERTKIVRTEDGAAYTEDDGASYQPISPDSIVSMNFWGFSASFLKELDGALVSFFEEKVPSNPLKAECYLPMEVDRLLNAGKATVTVLTSKDKWFGVTYKEDKPYVQASVKALKDAGVYPKNLWD
ncbi:MAG: nucleotidyltransferase [Lachnospiraceae bacterium]|nr:nucleotidyltransferase [Lachnospiraceae bacterium]